MGKGCKVMSRYEKLLQQLTKQIPSDLSKNSCWGEAPLFQLELNMARGYSKEMSD